MKKKLIVFLIIFSHILFAQSDCITAMTVCGNSDISYTPSGHGLIAENLGGCLSSERYSVWYSFTPATAGTLTFTIIPNNQNDDYDFAVYGPNKSCSNLGAPIRCSFSAKKGNTGLSMTATDLSENASGDKWVKYLTVSPGQTYYLIVNNFSQTANGFKLSWGGTATLYSPFTDPNIQPHPFMPPGTPGTNPNDLREILICSNSTTFDFSSLTTAILNGNPNFSISYHTNQNDALTGDNPLIGPQAVTAGGIYFYSIHYTNPTNPNSLINNCRQTGKFKFKYGTITATDVTLTSCNNNNTGTATYDLTTAAVFADPTATRQYYYTLSDLNAGINEITNINQLVSVEGKIYVKVISVFGCTDVAEITLKFYPEIIVKDAQLNSCSIESNPSAALFDLSTADVTSDTGINKKYYPSLADLTNDTNEISNFTAYTSSNSVVYVKIINSYGCYTIANITLEVIHVSISSTLTDKTICIDDTTELDAGPGYDGYEWSTGSTTQKITNVAGGTYWVILRIGKCTVKQTVIVHSYPQPVIESIDTSNNSAIIHVKDGTPPYQYRVEGNSNWQDSNIFTELSGGHHIFYVKDAHNCTPIIITAIIPHLVNTITPNGDGINDVFDFSVLSDKKNPKFIIYDRYGVKLYETDMIKNFKWDGTVLGREVPTGTYWYIISWNENDKNSTPVKFTGWILVKNRK
ncbi:gliding motility-associated C-terminal domain-containing protein [Chryseobacterium rhizoplanae]|uniref:T9SS type B sorting domain-containing protein n=1 Tax=Chryseobacterium rhizoplanae TaxID=1609531 RepID=UPI001CE32756|nr:gliding motility-associated C-terminal domain-containing protein [Chryseobacterium rhizoplanae]UCA61840.1 gliding motility-associated C-terminal domain-containing protein [Chryseobacterium rhizoplanae]